MQESNPEQRKEDFQYKPEHQTPEAIALKNKMLKTFIYSAGMIPQTFVFIKPQCASVIAEGRKKVMTMKFLQE